MYIHHLVFSSIATLLILFNVASAAVKSEVIDTTAVGYQNVATSTRFLRNRGGEEERGAISAGLEKVADLLGAGATKMAQTSHIQTWLSMGTSTDDAFKALELNKMGSNIFEDPKFMTWAVYVTKTEKENPANVILSKLKTQYTPDALATMIAAAHKLPDTTGLATMLQAQQRRVWLSMDQSTDDVFKLLKLDETKTELFKSPQFSTWTAYVDAVNKKNSDEAVSVIARLTKYHDEATLANMLEAAKLVPTTESLAIKLQRQQFQQWRTDGKSADDIFKLLKLGSSENILSDPRLNALSSYVRLVNKESVSGKETSLVAVLAAHYSDLHLAQLLEKGKMVPSTEKIATELQFQLFNRWFYQGKTREQIVKVLKLNKNTWNMDPNRFILRQYNKFFKKEAAELEKANLHELIPK